MIRPSQDSRRSLCQSDAQSRPTSPPPKQTKKRKPGPAESESESKGESKEESEDKLADTDDSEPVVVSKAKKKTRGSQPKSTTSKKLVDPSLSLNLQWQTPKTLPVQSTLLKTLMQRIPKSEKSINERTQSLMLSRHILVKRSTGMVM
jgi:hypothetical protein